MRWVEFYRDGAKRSGVDVGADAAQFLRWFDLMGVQRHLKVLGIFARLWHRDGKPGYLKDIAAHARLRAHGERTVSRAAFPEVASSRSACSPRLTASRASDLA